MLGVLQKLEEALSLARDEDPSVVSAIDGLKALVTALHKSKTTHNDLQSGGNGPPPHG